MSENQKIEGKSDDNAPVRIPVKQLTGMMLAGQNDLVMKYLRSLPKEECSKTRSRLIKNLETIQKKKRSATAPFPTSGASSSAPSTMRQKQDGGKDTIVGHHTRRSRYDRIQKEETLSQDPEVPLKKIGNYVLLEEIGKGMFATVYRGRNTESGEIIAAKEIEIDSVDHNKLPSIMREAQLLEKLRHENIVKIYEVIQTKKMIYFILEFMDKGSLCKILKKCGIFPEDLVSVYIRQTLLGLKYLHELQVIHRDIKCANILINSKGLVKLADFGAAKLEDTNRNFTVVGTPYWMAPEIIDMSGGGTVSDIWSLGCTIIELLTGQPPYFELSTMQALFNIVEDPHPPLPEGISSELHHFLLECCFIKDPKKRPGADILLQHPWIKKAENAPTLDYKQANNTIKNHNNLNRISVNNIDWSQKEADSPNSNLLPAGSTPRKSRNNSSTATQKKKAKRELTFANGAIRKEKSTTLSSEQLQAELEEVTRERDKLSIENEQLKKKLEQVTKERDSLKNGIK